MGNFLKLRYFAKFGDIFCNQGKLGVFWYVQDKKLFSKVNLCYQEGNSYHLILKWLAHKSFKLKIGYYSVTNTEGV